MKITKKTTFKEILAKCPEASKILVEKGMHCIGCPMAQQETIGMGCEAHGMSEKEIEDLIRKLNEIAKSKK